MKVRVLEKSDLDTLNEWLLSRGLSTLTWEKLPKCGVIMDGVAAGFLIKTDFDTAYIDFLISNPDTGREQRARGIDEVVWNLQQMAKDQGYKKIQATTQIQAVRARIKKEGGQYLGEFSSFVKEL